MKTRLTINCITIPNLRKAYGLFTETFPLTSTIFVLLIDSGLIFGLVFFFFVVFFVVVVKDFRVCEYPPDEPKHFLHGVRPRANALESVV